MRFTKIPNLKELTKALKGKEAEAQKIADTLIKIAALSNKVTEEEMREWCKEDASFGTTAYILKGKPENIKLIHIAQQRIEFEIWDYDFYQETIKPWYEEAWQINDGETVIDKCYLYALNI